MSSAIDPKEKLASLTTRPGAYRMLNKDHDVLYVGKAANLKARVSSYFSPQSLSARMLAMMSQVCDFEVTITPSEADALLLESNLIKQLKPRYNVVLRDDKSYPYIFISKNHPFPRLAFDRGKQQGKGHYYGPYPSASAVRQTLAELQKLFRMRQCEDNFYKNRSRPCLQYQIKRCTAPCVGLIDEQTYQQDIADTQLFLEGRNDEVIQSLVQRMDNASVALKYEEAAHYRDQITQLRTIYAKHAVTGETGDMDIVACAVEQAVSCVHIFYVRNGRQIGHKAFFPRTPDKSDAQEVLQAFIPQYYLKHSPPAELLISHQLDEQELLESTFKDKTGYTVKLISNCRGRRAKLLKMAVTNAENELKLRLASRQNQLQRFEDLQQQLELESLPERLECFDVSHTQGEATIASCVVFDNNGPVKSDYRKFNITDVKAGDDYAAMHQALERRYTRLKKGEGKMPDVLFIDGGKGQVQQALTVLEELQIDGLIVVGVAKGPERIAGREKLVIPHLDKVLELPSHQPALHLIQNIRDEAHRFAIAGHRAKRKKARTQSPLETIAGLGPKRRQTLLKNFGGMQGLMKASIDDLASTNGISRKLANEIYVTLHQANN